MAIFASFVHCLRNILHTWPHETRRLSGDTTVNDLGHISRSSSHAASFVRPVAVAVVAAEFASSFFVIKS